nr:DUF4401 domain-containing protein [Spartinivicinus marinus]
MPLYLRCLIGVGAFIASLCFIAFLFLVELIQFNNEAELVLWGLVFTAVAITLLKVAGEVHNAKQSFFIQLSFVAMAMGKTLFVLGVGIATESAWGVTCAILIITLITYSVYRISIDRFLSSFAVLASVMANIFWDKDLVSVREIVFNVFLFLQLLIAALLLCYEKVKRSLIPLSYAFVFSIIWAILILMDTSQFGYRNEQELISIMLPSCMLSISLIACMGWVAGSFSMLKSVPMVLATLVVIIIGFLSIPGVTLSILLLVLGYAKHENILSVTGVLFLPYCLVVFYYNLDITLLHKSVLLILSGLVLLAGRFCITYQGWDKCKENY